MKKISLFLLIVLLGCQDVVTPTSPPLKEVNTKTNGSNLRTGDLSFQGSLTANDREVILANLERSGHSLTMDDMNFLLNVMDETNLAIKSLEVEMPPSLRESDDWKLVIKNDPEAAAFVLKVERAVQDKILPAVPTGIRCGTWAGLILNIMSCLRVHSTLCKGVPGSCWSLVVIEAALGCILAGCP